MIQTLSDLQSYVAQLINDPTYTRYTLPLITSQLNLCQLRWNMEAKICRWTDFKTVTANVPRYALTGSNGLLLNPIQILRASFKGAPLNIRSKSYFDKYSAVDWTTVTGTPTDFIVDLNSLWNSDSNADGNVFTGPSYILHPTPQGNDAVPYSNNVGISGQNPLAVEYLAAPGDMVGSTDLPFIPNGYPPFTNILIAPYLAGLGLETAASILEPDPTAETVKKAQIFRAQANGYLSLVVQMYQGLEEDNPGRMSGGRSWQMGNSGTTQSW